MLYCIKSIHKSNLKNNCPLCRKSLRNIKKIKYDLKLKLKGKYVKCIILYTEY